MEWIEIEKHGYPDEDCRVLVWDNYFKEAKILWYNNSYECWDDEDGDDYYTSLNTERIPAYMYIKNYKGNA